MEIPVLSLELLLSLGFVKYQKRDYPYDVEAWIESYCKNGFMVHQNVVNKKIEFHYIAIDSLLGYQSRIIVDTKDLQDLYYVIRGERLEINKKGE